MHWTLPDLLALDPNVYAVLVEELSKAPAATDLDD